MELEVGDAVIIRTYRSLENEYGVDGRGNIPAPGHSLTKHRERWFGKRCVIFSCMTSIFGNQLYTLKGCVYPFPAAALLKVKTRPSVDI